MDLQHNINGNVGQNLKTGTAIYVYIKWKGKLIGWVLSKKTSFISQCENTLIATHEMYEQNITAFSPKPLSSFSFFPSLYLLKESDGKTNINSWGFLVIVHSWWDGCWRPKWVPQAWFSVRFPCPIQDAMSPSPCLWLLEPIFGATLLPMFI